MSSELRRSTLPSRFFWLLRVWLCAVMLLMPIGASAQDADTSTDISSFVLTKEGAPDYLAWSRVAERGERVLEIGRASDQALSELRSEIAQWRGLFKSAQDENSIRIDTLKTQLATLGPEPEDLGSELAVLAQRRKELNAELSKAQAPVKEAEESYARADFLVREIDSMLRTRQTDQLFKLGPTPLNPAAWSTAFAALKKTFATAASETRNAWGSDAQRRDLQADLPVTIALLVIGLVLLTQSRGWLIRLGGRLRQMRKGPSRGVVGFVISLGQVIAPMLGLSAFLIALNLAGVLGLRGQAIADALPAAGLLFFVALWIGTRVFGAEASHASLYLPSSVLRAEARINVTLLGLLLGILVVLRQVGAAEAYSESTVVVLAFPVLVGASVLLVRMGRLLRRHLGAQDSGNHSAFRTRVISGIGRVCEAVGFVSPIAAAVGYTAFAEALLLPTILTLAVLAVLEILNVFVKAVYATVIRADDEIADQALFPVIVSFCLLLAALPLLALIWGARATDLAELWAQFLNGFQMGSTRITPRAFLVFAIIFVGGYAATRALQATLRSSILPKTNLDKGGQNAIAVGTGYVGLFLAAVIAITGAGIDLSSVAIIAGALSVGIGFGLQTIVSNFVSGIILLIERPISEGDWIEVNGQMGYVRDISVRATRIETFDRSDVILPNSDLVSGVVTNYTRGNSIGRVIIPVGVAYGTDTRCVETILREIAEAHPMVTVNPSPAVIFQGFGADSLDFEIRAILSDVNFMLSVKSEINHEIARRFVEEGIEIPFAQRDIWLRNPEALSGGATTPKADLADVPAQNLTRDSFTVEDMNGEGEGDE
ncbi:Small-conductance mechanosensitive channel [Aliiroseovarius halocynthiae]|uniref:Mechanosensitive ion channel family protein n=1 Tax=Aliiroseovarius halocynthiae TaxID=985055 RepID=A0A545SVG3_9RHOB|nr:DUF3772 domain-containing protein [Aliiroseovarius halocynthiae]TQV68961.1 mechanosensitive ion channel family protein [Aliiroseovarius halocynthiae]SMR71703.1 Small-conductance mechanosensitive channel [Aliiroseovarius halocynthiae]